MTADSTNEWYQQILSVSKEIGENLANTFSHVIFVQSTIPR